MECPVVDPSLHEALEGLEPKEVWLHFNAIRQIPRPTHKEAKLHTYIQNWAQEHGWESALDTEGNLVVYVPGSPEYNSASPIILQAHTDMVCVKREEAVFDFEKDAIDLERDGDTIRSKGQNTTTGFDNGFGVAAIMALAESDIPHAPLELVFTRKEEIGLKGAAKFDGTLLKGKRLINIDSEDGMEWVTVASAGAQRYDVQLPTDKREEIKNDHVVYKVAVSGFPGGHSGVKIHETNRGNAIQQLGRTLKKIIVSIPDVSLHSARGGIASNAIPGSAQAYVSVPENAVDDFVALVAESNANDIRHVANPDGTPAILAEALHLRKNATHKFLQQGTRDNLINILANMPTGPLKMSDRFQGLVHTSSNIGIAKSKKKYPLVLTGMTRSSVDAEQMETTMNASKLAATYGAQLIAEEGYSGWEAKPDSLMLATAQNVSMALWGRPMKERRVHAGLETGVFDRRIGGNPDMTSFGPFIKGAHTAQESISKASAIECWEFLKVYVTALTKQN